MASERMLRGVQPSAGMRAAYQRRLLRLVDDMTSSVLYWTSAAWRAAPPLATDETPAAALERALNELAARWLSNWREGSARLATWFSEQTELRSRRQLMRILREAGFAVDFRMTPAMRDVLRATVAANAALIRSIPEQYMTQVRGILMRGAQSGRDLATVTSDLRKQTGVTRRRAELIARDQAAKATAAFTRARYMEVGITEAVWVHSGGGHEPRPTHVAAGVKATRYDVAKGWYDPHERRHIQPGELINCRCFARPVVKGFTQ
jgi:uncharacterized protein with gpF-like domain